MVTQPAIVLELEDSNLECDAFLSSIDILQEDCEVARHSEEVR